MPVLGFGTYQIPDGEAVELAVLMALESGYRCIDTAELYANEGGIGRALKRSGLDRGDLFVATKVWNSSQGYDMTMAACERSLNALDLDYLDLYLVHWPVRDLYHETWRALEGLYRQGLVRAIGVSNFTASHLDELMGRCEIRPMVNQVEFHPLLYQKELLDYCRAAGIQVQAWRPLLKGAAGGIDLLNRLAQRYERTPAQIALRWLVQLGIAVIPRSVNRERIRENARIFDFTLSSHDMEQIAQLNRNERLGPDPDNFDF